jgi:hypothetical protein
MISEEQQIVKMFVIQLKTVITPYTLKMLKIICFVWMWKVTSWQKNKTYKCLKTLCSGKIFGIKNDQVSEQFKILLNEELTDLFMLGWWNQGDCEVLGMWLGWGKQGVLIGKTSWKTEKDVGG